MAEHSALSLPWFVGAQNDSLYIIDGKPAKDNDYPHHDYGPAAIAKVYHHGAPGVAEARAAFIVRACNSHDALLAAAQRAFVLLENIGERVNRGERERDYHEERNALRAAIAAAEPREEVTHG